MIQTPGTASKYQASILAALQTTGITNTSPGAKARAFCDATGDQVSPPFRNQNISRARQTETPVHDRGPRLFLAPSPCSGGQARVGLSVLPHRKHLARARLKPAFSLC